MNEQLSATYEDGLLRPLKSLNLPENSRVNLTIEIDNGSPHSLLQFAGILSDQEAEELENIIKEEFNQVTDNEW